MAIRLRAGIHATVDGDRVVLSLSRLDEVVEIDDPDGRWAAVTARLAGLDAPAHGPVLGPEELEEALALLVEAGFAVDDAPLPAGRERGLLAALEHELPTPARRDAAFRQIRAAHVLVIGAGGVGSWLALDLALAGIATLSVVDPDVVEDANLARQPYEEGDVGERKVAALGRMLRARRADLAYRGVPLLVDEPGDLAALLDGVDLVISAGDQPSAGAVAALVAHACVPRGVPHLTSAYAGGTVRVGPTWTGRGRRHACGACGEVDQPTGLTARAAVPITASDAQVAAALAASEALRCLAGLRLATRGSVRALDLRRMQARRVRVAIAPGCTACGGTDPLTGMGTPTTRGEVA